MRHSGFTLAELLVGVTVSAIIMTAVTVFVGSGIENAFRIRKGMSENQASAAFDARLSEISTFGGELAYSGVFDAPYGSGIVLRNSDRPIPLAVIATESFTGLCDAFSGTADDPGPLTRLSIRETYLAGNVQNAAPYSIDHTGASVRDASSAIAVGTGENGLSGGNGSAGTSTQLSFPSAIADAGGGKYLVADTGNDRVLVFDGTSVTTLLGADSGIRHPREIAIDGASVFVTEDRRVWEIQGNPASDPSVLSGSFEIPSAFSFDTVEISLGGGSVPSADAADYAFDFGPASGTAAVVGSVSTLELGSTFSYSAGDVAQILASGITPGGSAAAGWYQATLRYLAGGTEQYHRTVAYFVKGDGDPFTPADNAVRIVADSIPYPNGLSVSGGTPSYETDVADFAALPASATVARSESSKRVVDGLNFSLSDSLLTLTFNEYVRFDCVGGQHVKRERIFKIPVR